MGVLVAFTIGAMFWIAGTALGIKSFDAFLVLLALVMLAVVARLAGPFVRERILP
jgi:hypothetical protein